MIALEKNKRNNDRNKSKNIDCHIRKENMLGKHKGKGPDYADNGCRNSF